MLPSRKEIDGADVIIGVNEKTGAHTVFYGKGLLSPIANGYEGPRVCASATVSSVHRYAASTSMTVVALGKGGLPRGRNRLLKQVLNKRLAHLDQGLFRMFDFPGSILPRRR
jgi:hypothetical protein